MIQCKTTRLVWCVNIYLMKKSPSNNQFCMFSWTCYSTLNTFWRTQKGWKLRVESYWSLSCLGKMLGFKATIQRGPVQKPYRGKRNCIMIYNVSWFSTFNEYRISLLFWYAQYLGCNERTVKTWQPALTPGVFSRCPETSGWMQNRPWL